MRRALPAVAIAALLLTFPRPVAANDTAAGGYGSDVVPLQTAGVRMMAEDIVITHRGREWHVEADYTFANLTDRTITVQVAFPEYACEGGDPETDPDVMCDPEPLRFASMRTTVDGKAVKHRRGKIRADHPWRPRLGQVWLYDVTFAPGKTTRIVHRYSVRQGESSDGTVLGNYVTRTGATWAGTIGQARFRIRVPASSREVRFGPDDSGLALTLHVVDVDGKATGEILLQARDWEPTTDLFFEFRDVHGPSLNETLDLAELGPIAALPPNERCTNLVALWQRGETRAVTAGPAAEPLAADVDRFVKEGIGNARICRNFVYAAYGRRFEDDALNRYFYGSKGFVPGSWPYGPFEPNPGFNEAMLTAGDRAILRLIDAVERKLAAGGREDAGAAAQPTARPDAPAPPAPAQPAPAPQTSGADGPTADSAAAPPPGGCCGIARPGRAERHGLLAACALLLIGAWRRRITRG